MKKQVWLLALLAGLIFGGATQVAVPTTAHAKAQRTLTAYPKRLRGTWYHYDGQGKYDRVSFTAKKWRTVGYDNNQRYASTLKLHQRPMSADADQVVRHPKWVVGLKLRARHASWIDLRGWNQSAGDGTYYKVANKYYRGQKLRVMSEAGGGGLWVIQHYYPSKHVAKQMKDHRFPGEVYYAS
ncbi:hypothetical protein KB236_07605 [Levilactobacillus brevis]|uniref:Uncharacterized protein n=1 Tax=Levilactobacillus hammesii TaxID=267633 RepID=A0A921JXD7_9LACO|nr:hypothetical protein KB236_07605 [Levilactobacillus brevis]HJE86727.1 hypothetical protein [Levilactobacillus hammesii]